MDRSNDSLMLGVESMDSEHCRLAALFEEFAACVRDDTGRARQIVQDALVLTNEHFAHEEQLMAEHAYPGAEEEKFQHRNLRLKLTTLVSTTLAMPANDSVTLENLADMERMLVEHIIGPDRALADYLIARGVR